MLTEAKRLVAMGWSVHWLRPKSKMPIEKNWTTVSRKSIDELKKSYRTGFNIGVRLGDPIPDGGFLAVIDCDCKKPEARSEMLAALGRWFVKKNVKFGPMVTSGRGNGSCHIYIRTTKPIHQLRIAASKHLITVEGKRPTPEWDIILYSKGRQVVVPPSIHPVSGKPYEWAGYEGKVLMPERTALPLLDLEDTGGAEGPLRETLNDWRPVPVDLISSPLSDKMVAEITSGVGVVDRSAALFGAAIAMKKAGFDKMQILSVLTNRNYFLGQTGYDHRNTGSRKAAAEWVARYTFRKAEGVASSRDDFSVVEKSTDDEVDEERAREAAKDLTEEGHWTTKFERGQNGRPKVSLKNLLLVFENEGDGPFLIRDDFAVEDIWTRPTVWGNFEAQTLNDDHCRAIKEYLTVHYRFEPSVVQIIEAMKLIATRNRRHPVREYLKGLRWDKRPRVKRWLFNYLNAKGPDKYVEAVGVKTLVAMVARVMEPGVKFDHVLILEGEQGVGKSSAARILSSPWFSDAFLNVSDKDAVMNMQGTWVNELGELSAMTRSEVNSIKEFVTRQTDKIRPPYGALPIKYPRQNIFIGTTNNRDYLKDRTGNRRFWPVSVGRLKRAELEKDRDQLMAEAYALYMVGEPLYLEPSVESLARTEQALRLEYDELQDVLDRYLNSKNCKLGDEFNFFELIEQGPAELGGLKNDRSTQMRIGVLLRSLGFENESKWSTSERKMSRKWRRKIDQTT